MGKPRIVMRPTPMLRKQIGQMQKLLGVYSKKKVQYLETEKMKEPANLQTEGIPDFLSQNRGVRPFHVNRRQFVMNRHFTEIISDVLATDFKHEIDSLGINITSIETKAWNKGVNVFFSTKEEIDNETRQKLKNLVVHLRAAVTERQLIGRTPNINFLQDRSVLLDQNIEEALSRIKLDDDNETRVSVSSANQLYITKDLGSQEQKLVSKRFLAPRDMDNTILGLNYPELYDEVALKLSKGRGDASRMVIESNFLVGAKPLFRMPREEDDELDPAARLKRMQKFIISQKQKNIRMARTKRMNEILDRESTKLVVDDIDDQDDEEDKS